MMGNISYFCHFNVLNSMSLKFNVLEAGSKKKSFPSLPPPIQSPLLSPKRTKFAGDLRISLVYLCVEGEERELLVQSCGLVSCPLSHLAFRHHDLTCAVVWLPLLGLWVLRAGVCGWYLRYGADIVPGHKISCIWSFSHPNFRPFPVLQVSQLYYIPLFYSSSVSLSHAGMCVPLRDLQSLLPRPLLQPQTDIKVLEHWGSCRASRKGLRSSSLFSLNSF